MSKGARKTKWVRTEDRVPEHDEKVLVCGPLGGVYIAKWWRGSFQVYPEKKKWFEWWMPLPDIPDEVSEGMDWFEKLDCE